MSRHGITANGAYLRSRSAARNVKRVGEVMGNDVN